MADQLPGICWDVTTRLFGYVKVHAACAFKLKKNVTSLHNKLVELQNIRKDVETTVMEAEGIADMKRTNEVDGWLQQALNLQQIIIDIEAHGSQEILNTCVSGHCPKNFVSRYKIGRTIVEKTLEVDELLTSGKHFLDKNVDIALKLPPNLVDEMPFGETVGLELVLNKVCNSIIDEKVGIIGLYGMGGAGKTTLLKRVHNELGKREHMFDLVLWVVVSKDCNISKVMNDIRNKIRVQDDFWNYSDDDHRAAKIHQILKQKRFVLLLDDLWGKLELERIGVPHPKETNFQSKVVLTTRSEDVCDKMDANVAFKVECLREKEAFELFCRKVGQNTLKHHREIPEIAREMAKECGGLPLALVTVGSAMAGVKSVESWRRAISDLSNFSLIGEDYRKVFSVLKFSYDRLPNEAHQQCFLYCALYPEDYLIEVEELVDRWIGEGFLSKGKNKMSIYDMRDEGRSIIDKLKLSSLLEDANDVSLFWYWEPKIKMHDVIRDMALWVARDEDEENKDKVVVQREALEMDSERCNVVERISVTDVKEEETWQLPICPNLLTLLCSGNHHLQITELSNLEYMTRLKVLHLSDNEKIRCLPPEIGKLINLEFLNLSGIIRKLPIEVKNLSKLRVLIMESNEFEIPLEVFENLRRLQVFRLRCEHRITEEGEEILLDKLESLPDLEELGISLKTMNGLHKLLESNKLHRCVRNLDLHELEELEMTGLVESFSTMKHLESLAFYELVGMKDVLSITHTCHLHKLRQLDIWGCDSITHLTWLRYAPLLESLVVSYCESMEEVVKGGQDDDDDDVGMDSLFSNLKKLMLEDLPKLNSIHNRALPFPSLNCIYVRGCDNLRKLPLNSNSAKDTLIQIFGETQWWNNLEWEDPSTRDLFHSKFQAYRQ